MKRIIVLFIILFSVAIHLMADNDIRVIVLDGKGGFHSEYYAPADMPEVYFDADNLEITLVADGFSTYYNVEIFLTGYNVPVISTQVDGYGDTIDVSSLTDNDYDIVITSEFNNRFVGQFTVE